MTTNRSRRVSPDRVTVVKDMSRKVEVPSYAMRQDHEWGYQAFARAVGRKSGLHLYNVRKIGESSNGSEHIYQADFHDGSIVTFTFYSN